jgi:hypothetical protein
VSRPSSGARHRTRGAPLLERRRALAGWTAVMVLVVLLVGAGTAVAGPSDPLSRLDLRVGAGHACVVGGQPPTIAWRQLHNPVLADPSGGVKDQAVVWVGGLWHALFSYVTDDPTDPEGVRWNIATATSPDLAHWSPVTPWPLQSGVLGVASPDLVRDRTGRFVVTYQSDPGASSPSGEQARLFYRTSADLRRWSAPHALAPNLAPAASDRMIDAALVSTGHQLLLGFKFSSPTQPDVFELARSISGRLRGPWTLIGRPDITVNAGTVENGEFVRLFGQWRLLATSDNLDQPWLFTLAGNPNRPRGWLDWTDGYALTVPAQAFNTGPGISSIGFEHANSAFICATGQAPGSEVYLFYAGSPELTQFDGWGHAAVGVARSRDLVHWRVPPG